LNEASQAKEGIDPSVFPQDVPVFTGHYHKPHVVKGTRIEYVGSPYQVSAGECNQKKHFLVLDKEWQVSMWIHVLSTYWLVYALDVIIFIYNGKISRNLALFHTLVLNLSSIPVLVFRGLYT